MNIIAHRGFWKNRAEMNTSVAFSRAVKNNYGIETDVRDYCGDVVISHDVPNSNEIMTFDEFIYNYVKDCRKYNFNTTLAINIKSDGLHFKINEILSKHQIKNYFLFDMSIPDSMMYLDLNKVVYYRMSEYENVVNTIEGVQGIWLDQFKSNWFNKKSLETIMNNWKNICVVSPELHNRSYSECWSLLKSTSNYKDAMICNSRYIYV